ncbi:hypothetical protein KNO15_06835 [Leifsonia shinshuensis]|uniref:hypothetical protein n=1 Tax=Leifsonia shinshuensis TaxID=150026 RepID=UPI001F50B8E3|nr:hypothetical protein [Leifsonia shinshuensis]MCI0156408.1 hypothetical protein [Leifsonia shinshuensis]
MADHEERHLSSLKSFVLRARRIRAHSLARDAKLLMELQNPRLTIHFTPETGDMRVIVKVPPEEQVESAAARVRPLILNGEDTYHAKVMNALLYFAQKAGLSGSGLESLREMKRQWAKTNPNGKNLGFYEVRVQTNGEPESRISDNALAFSWIYGDVVHADTARRDEGRAYGVEERYRAAIPVVARLMMLAMVTLTITERLRTDGVLPDLGDAFDEDVVITATELAVETQVYVAEYDEGGRPPEPPAMDEEFGDEWKPFAEAFKDQISTTTQPASDQAGDDAPG